MNIVYNSQGHFVAVNGLHPPQQSFYSFFTGMFCKDLEDPGMMILEKTEAAVLTFLPESVSPFSVSQGLGDC